MRPLYKSAFIVALLLTSAMASRAQSNAVAIGTSTPDASAVLLLVGNGTQGLIIPIANLTSAGSSFGKAGMIVYNSADKKVYYHDGTQWTSFAAKSYTLTVNASDQLILSDGTTNQTVTLPIAGDVTGASVGSTTVTGIQGKVVPSLSTVSGAQYLSYDATQGKWIFQTPSGSLPTINQNQILSNDGTNTKGFSVGGDLTLATGANANFSIANTAATGGNIISAINSGSTTINGARVNPAFGSQNISTTGTLSSGNTTVTGLTVSGATTSFNNKTYTWPNNPTLTAGKFLQTDASGNLTWASLSGGGDMSTSTYDTNLNGIVDNSEKIGGSTWPANANGVLTNDGTGALTWAPGSGTYTAGTGLTLAANAFSVNTSQNISTLSNLTSNGLIKTSSGTGALSIATSGTDYLAPFGSQSAKFFYAAPNGAAGVPSFRAIVASDIPTLNQNTTGSAGSVANALTVDNSSIQLSSGTTYNGSAAVTMSVKAAGITNAMLAGSIAASKLIGTDITTVGTITAGTWNGTKISEAYGGTNQTSYAAGDILYASSPTTLTKLAIGSPTQVLTVNAGGTAPVWAAASGNSSWGLSGNAGTTPGTNFIGTTDLKDLVFKANNGEVARITSGGNVGIGITNPSYPLSVQTSSAASAIYAQNTASSSSGISGAGTSAGVQGSATAAGGFGVSGQGDIGVYGSGTVYGVQGFSSSSTGIGVYGNNVSGGFAGYFYGPLVLNGALGFGGTPNYGTTGQVLTSNGPGNLPSWSSAGGSGWTPGGNSGTVDGAVGVGTNYIGTKDNVPLNFLVNNQEAGRIDQVSFNTSLGYNSSTNITTGNDNTALGYAALNTNTSGNHNLAIGANADVLSGTLSNASAIGYNARVASSNSMVLGGTGANAVNVGIGTTTPISVLDVTGDLHLSQITAPTPTTDKLYNVGGSLFWNGTNISSVVPLQIPANGDVFEYSANNTVRLNINNTSGQYEFGKLNTAGTPVFSTNWNTGNTYIAGNLGVGTSSPATTLDVNGNAYIRGSFIGLGGATSTIGSSALVLLDDNGASSYGGMYINSNATGKPFYGYALGGSNVAWTYVDGTDSKKWKLNNGTTDVVTVDQSGNVGIGTTAPTYMMHVNGSASVNTFNVATTTSGALSSSATFSGGVLFQNQIILNAAQNVTGSVVSTFDNIFDLGSSSYRWHYVYAGNGTIQTSDVRLKDNVKSLNYGLKEVMSLRPVSYTWKKDSTNKVNLGLIAQEVLKVVPEAVHVPTDGGYLGMNYSNLIPVLIKSIQEQQKLIDEQKKQIEGLKQQQTQKETKAELELIQLKAEIANIKKALGMEASAGKDRK